MKHPLFWLISLFLFLVACTSTPPTAVFIANQPTATFPAVITFTPSPTLTPSTTPDRVATALAQPTLTPTITFTPSPTFTPNPTLPPFVSPIDLAAGATFEGAVLAPDNVGNLQKLNSWGKEAAVWASYSPDGSQVAVLTQEKFYLYQAGSDNEIYAVSVPAGQWFVSAAASSDWQWLALGLNDERVLIYSLANNSFQYEINSQAVVGMQFLPNTTILLTREWGWNVATNQPVTTNFPGGVISADGQTVVTEALVPMNEGFGYQQQVGYLTWENETLQFSLAPQINTSADRMSELALSPDGSKFALADWSPVVQVWDTQTGALLYQVDVQFPEKLVSAGSSKSRRFSPAKHSGPDRYFGESVAFSPDGKWLIAHNGDNDLLFWEADTGKFVQRWADAEKHISFTADLTKALTWDGSVTEWSKTGEKLFEQPAHLKQIKDLLFIPNSNKLVLSTGDVLVIEYPTLTLTGRFDTPSFQLALLADGETIVYNHYQAMFFHHLPTGRVIQRHHPYSSPWGISSLIVSPNGRWLGSWVANDKAQVWYIESWVEQLVINNTMGSENIVFTPDSKFLVRPNNYQYSIDFWLIEPEEGLPNQPNLSLMFPEEIHISMITISPNGQYLVAQALRPEETNYQTFVYDIQNQTILVNLATSSQNLFFSSDNQLLFTSQENVLSIWQTADWSLIQTLEFDQEIIDMSLSADGRLLALAFTNGYLELWGIPQP